MGKKDKSAAAAAKQKASTAEPRRPFSVMDLPDLPSGSLPPAVELARTRIVCGPDFNSNVRDESVPRSALAAAQLPSRVD
jgi:hypothetical protein